MSKFFKALEQADRERALREQTARQQTQPDMSVSDAATKQEPPPLTKAPKQSGQRPASPDGERTERFLPRQAEQAPESAAETSDGIEEHLVSLLKPTSFEAEQYRALRHIIEQKHRGSDLHMVAITSPTAGDGKTTTAINLAGALAQAPQTRVLLLEADMRRPCVSERLDLGHSNGRSFVDAILDPALSLKDVVRLRPPFSLAVLPASYTQGLSYEVLRSPRLGALLDEARRHYDYVIVDTPPLIPFPDCQLIGNWIDGVLIVVAAHRTPRKLLEEALNVVDPEKLIGFVFNNDDRPVFGYHGHYVCGYDQSLNGGRMGRLSRAVRGIVSSLWRRSAFPERRAR
jgi:capsular exopolysaccharide synthesis family protein